MYVLLFLNIEYKSSRCIAVKLDFESPIGSFTAEFAKRHDPYERKDPAVFEFI